VKGYTDGKVADFMSCNDSLDWDFLICPRLLALFDFNVFRGNRSSVFHFFHSDGRTDVGEF